jgi:hypothetical protein
MVGSHCVLAVLPVLVAVHVVVELDSPSHEVDNIRGS